MQLAAVMIITALAAAYVARSAWRTWSGTKIGCHSGCGKCAPEPELQKGRISLPQI